MKKDKFMVPEWLEYIVWCDMLSFYYDYREIKGMAG